MYTLGRFPIVVLLIFKIFRYLVVFLDFIN